MHLLKQSCVTRIHTEVHCKEKQLSPHSSFVSHTVKLPGFLLQPKLTPYQEKNHQKTPDQNLHVTVSMLFALAKKSTIISVAKHVTSQAVALQSSTCGGEGRKAELRWAESRNACPACQSPVML